MASCRRRRQLHRLNVRLSLDSLRWAGLGEPSRCLAREPLLTHAAFSASHIAGATSWCSRACAASTSVYKTFRHETVVLSLSTCNHAQLPCITFELCMRARLSSVFVPRRRDASF